MENMTLPIVKESLLKKSAHEGMDEFIQTILYAIWQEVGEDLNAVSMSRLNADQVTLWGYHILRDELMNGGFIQLIHNGYGPFFFDNPFAKAMRLFGVKDLSKLLYRARELYEAKGKEITKDCSDEAFMSLFEQFPEFDDLDDEFVENEENYTARVAYYVDEHLDSFVRIEKDEDGKDN